MKVRAEVVKTRRTRYRWPLALAGVALAGITGVAWGMAVYIGLVRLQVRAMDVGSRVEAASRARAELAANVIHTADAFACLAPDRLTALREATDRATRARIAPRLLDEPEPHREILLAHEDLTSVLEEFWPTLRATRGAGAHVLAEDLETRLESARLAIVECLSELEGSIDAYEAATSRFPGSVVASVATGNSGAVLRSWVSESSGAGSTPPSARSR
jgi:hypothetical protein